MRETDAVTRMLALTRPGSTRRLVPLGLLAALALLAGCGGQAGPSTGTVTPGPTTSGAAASPATSAGVDASPAAQPSGTASSAGAPSTTPTCAAPATPTTAQTEGPYFKAGSPERSNLVEPGMAGTALTLVGFVVTTSCAPISGAVVDLWQADASGTYDNSGYTLRGHVRTDAAGRFVVQTIVPGEYPGRTEHIHVKVTPPGGATLTTQLYFPGVTANDGDGIYSPDLLLDIVSTGDAMTGTFTFVLAAG